LVLRAACGLWCSVRRATRVTWRVFTWRCIYLGLQVAAQEGNLAACEALLSLGGDVRAMDCDGEAPARRCGSVGARVHTVRGDAAARPRCATRPPALTVTVCFAGAKGRFCKRRRARPTDRHVLARPCAPHLTC
jgi:hypothetical protein